MSKLPAIQFYPGDWRKDVGVQSLSFHDRGVWFEILMLMHESEERGVLTLNGKPMKTDALARLLGLDNQILTTALTNLEEAGVSSVREDGALFNRRMVKDENLRKVRTEAGKLGGNPVLVKQKSTTRVKQKSTPSSSSSSLKQKRDAVSFILPEWVNQEAWSGYVDMRQKIRKPLTERAKALAIKDLEVLRARGEDQVAVLNTATMKSWMGIYPVTANGVSSAHPGASPRFVDPANVYNGSEYAPEVA